MDPSSSNFLYNSLTTHKKKENSFSNAASKRLALPKLPERKRRKKNIVKTLEGEKAVVKSLISFAFVVIFSSEQQLAFLYGYMDLVV